MRERHGRWRHGHGRGGTRLRGETQRSPPARARALGLQLELLSVRGVDEVEPAFEAAVKIGVQAVVATAGGLGLQYQQQIIRSAARHQMPAVYLLREFVEAGELMSYGANLFAGWHRAASYVDKILRGAKPSDLGAQLLVNCVIRLFWVWRECLG